MSPVLSLAYALLSIASGAVHLAAGGSATDASRPPELASAAPDAILQQATFSADGRAVTNWREEAVEDLYPTPLSALAVALKAERPVVTRCVKLNNYWCIKSARWNGEIGTDDEGHVGFASAEHGADAAVRLLRRYYLDFDRKSALDIVRRWAPAECRIAGGGSAPPATLAVRGIGNTVRARWLAGRRTKPARTKMAAVGGAVPIPQKPAPSRVSAVPLRPLPTVSMPSIMAGVSAPKPTVSATLPARVPQRRQPTPASVAAAKAAAAKKSAVRAVPSRPATVARAPVSARPSASLPAKAALAPPPRPVASAPAAAPPPRPLTLAPAAAPPPVPRAVFSCAPDEQRIQNYAGRMVQSLGLKPGDDLNLFEPDGRPLPNLARVLLAMSSFELGYLRASAELVQGAIARATPPAAPPPPAPDRSGTAPSEPIL
jgi:hypothetical protein